MKKKHLTFKQFLLAALVGVLIVTILSVLIMLPFSYFEAKDLMRAAQERTLKNQMENQAP